MGTLCSSYIHHRIEPTTPTSARSINLKSISNTLRRIPKRKELFDQVYDCEIRKLGYGHYGDVKKCVHKTTGVTRAVKIYNRDRIGSQSITESQFLRQINILSQISHPCFIRVHEYFEEMDYFYLLMDYHHDGDLLQKQRDHKRLSENYVKKIIRKILTGVAYLHRLNIAHRDLKPENILISEKGNDVNLKIIDFDTSDKLDENGFLSGLFGTPYFMAPEMLKKKYDLLCDIWSVGIIMYNLLTGALPFPKLSDHQFLASLQKFHLNLNSHELIHVSENCKKLLKAMLTKNPQKRITAEEALADPWLSEADFESVNLILSSIQINKLKSTDFKDCLISNFSTLQDFEDLDRAFVELDKDCDGLVCEKDFQELLSKSFSKFETEFKTSELMSCFRGYSDGFIPYEEFLKATLDLNILLDEARIVCFLSKRNAKIELESEEGIEEDWLLELKEKIENGITPQSLRSVMLDKLFINY